MKIFFPYAYNVKTALLLQIAFGALLLLCAFMNLRSMRLEEESGLHSEAGRIASRVAFILSAPVFNDDYLNSRQIVFAEMEDSRVAALAVFKGDNIIEGQRRDFNWEAVPWDDLLPEDSVEGLKNITMEDEEIGKVVVYLSRRVVEESLALAARREAWRFMAVFVFMALAQIYALKKTRLAENNILPQDSHTISQIDGRNIGGSEDTAKVEPEKVPDALEKASAASEKPLAEPEKTLAASSGNVSSFANVFEPAGGSEAIGGFESAVSSEYAATSAPETVLPEPAEGFEPTEPAEGFEPADDPGGAAMASLEASLPEPADGFEPVTSEPDGGSEIVATLELEPAELAPADNSEAMPDLETASPSPNGGFEGVGASEFAAATSASADAPEGVAMPDLDGDSEDAAIPPAFETVPAPPEFEPSDSSHAVTAVDAAAAAASAPVIRPPAASVPVASARRAPARAQIAAPVPAPAVRAPAPARGYYASGEEDDFFRACQYGPLNLIILAADEDFAALRDLAEELAARSLAAGYKDLYNHFTVLREAASNSHGSAARLAEDAALVLSKVLRALANGR